MICHDCGGSDLQGTCVCCYEWPEPDLEREARIRKGYETGFCEECDRAYLACTCDGEQKPIIPPPYPVTVPNGLKQICHFCGVDLFLRRTDLNIRMCVPCGLALNHVECCKCVVCNNVWLVDGEGSVCQSCKSL